MACLQSAEPSVLVSCRDNEKRGSSYRVGAVSTAAVKHAGSKGVSWANGRSLSYSDRFSFWRASAVQAAELQVIAGGGIAAALNEIAVLFERASGHKVVIRYGTAPELIKMAASDVRFDLGVAPQDVWTDAAARAQLQDILQAGWANGISRHSTK